MQQKCKLFEATRRQKAYRDNRQAFKVLINYSMAYVAGGS